MVTFTRVSQTYDAATDTMTSTSSTVTGSAMQVRPNYRRYKALGLALETVLTLFFVPTTYGDVPLPGDTVVWGSTTYTVRDVETLAPDGVLLAARVAIAV